MHFSSADRWPIFSLGRDGLLIDEDGSAPFETASPLYPAQPRFENAGQAEEWLVSVDARGSVK